MFPCSAALHVNGNVHVPLPVFVWLFVPHSPLDVPQNQGKEIDIWLTEEEWEEVYDRLVAQSVTSRGVPVAKPKFVIGMVNGVHGVDGMPRPSACLVHYVAFILCAVGLGKADSRVVAKHEWGKRRTRTSQSMEEVLLKYMQAFSTVMW